jgi:hypothetical protein
MLGVSLVSIELYVGAETLRIWGSRSLVTC